MLKCRVRSLVQHLGFGHRPCFMCELDYAARCEMRYERRLVTRSFHWIGLLVLTIEYFMIRDNPYYSLFLYSFPTECGCPHIIFHVYLQLLYDVLKNAMYSPGAPVFLRVLVCQVSRFITIRI